MEEHRFTASFTRDPVAVAVEFPDLPGCFTQGDNYREAFPDAKEALPLHLIGMITDGEEITRTKDIVFALIETKI